MPQKPSYSYRLRTLTVEGIADYRLAHLPPDGGENGALVLPMYEPTTYDTVVSGESLHAENAFCYQLLMHLSGEDADLFERLRQDRNALTNELLYLNFSATLSSANPLTADGARQLLEEGLSLRLAPNAEPVHFVPFDKSGSMSRTNRICFLRAEHKAAMDKRLMLDMAGFTVNLSKMYAYRGLYLSDAVRVSGLDLNEDTVIVLPDKIVKKQKAVPVLTAEAEKPDKPDLWNTKTAEQKPEINAFDGEGFVSPAWAKQLASAAGARGATSFQVRMPLVKGMLHQVDWSAFFDQELDCAGTVLEVTDAFGFRRDLRKAQILLTESMFKCGSWLRKVCDTEDQRLLAQDRDRQDRIDPMAYYFDRFRRYQHGLYISNTDKSVTSNTGWTRLNYQFLNPLALQSGDLEALAKQHFERLEALRQDAGLAAAEAVEQDDPDPEQAPEEDRSPLVSSGSAWAMALLKNPDFCTDRTVKQMAESLYLARLKDTAEGKLLSRGCCRFLSGDLLGLLYTTAKRSWLNGVKLLECRADQLKAVGDARLAESKFYLPGVGRLNPKRTYPLLRNPHLSRNEECALYPLVPNERAKRPVGRLYQTYFSHLTGVVMIAQNTLTAMALSGADFDGDLVKVFFDPVINNAICREVYDDEMPRSRRLPVVVIPALSAANRTIPEKVDPDTIKDTFNSRVGHLSNLAFKFGEAEYWRGEEQFQNRAAECTILTGLEIDAAKTGRHPDLETIEDAGKKLNKDTGRYLSDLRELRALRRYRKDWNAVPIDGGYQIIRGSSTRRIRASEDPPYVQNLPAIYLRQLTAQPPASEAAETEAERRNNKTAQLFTFDRAAPAEPDPAIRREVRGGLLALRAVLAAASERSSAVSMQESGRYGGRARSILIQQYGSQAASIDAAHPEWIAEQIYEQARRELLRCFLDRSENRIDPAPARACLDRIISEKWQFAVGDARRAMLENLTDGSLSEPVRTLLLNFRCGGWCLLYYLVKDIWLRLRVLLYDEGNTLTPPENAVHVPERDLAQYQRCYAVLSEQYLSDIRRRADASLWKRDLNDIFRRRLEALRPEHLTPEAWAEQQLWYVYRECSGADRGHKLFWELFSWREIEPYILERKEAEANAG